MRITLALLATLCISLTVRAQTPPDTVWTQTYWAGIPYDEFPLAVLSLPDGGYLLANTRMGAGIYPLLHRLNSNGGIIWTQHYTWYDTPDYDDDIAGWHDIAQLPGGGFVIYVGGGEFGFDQRVIMRLDDQGSEVWSRTCFAGATSYYTQYQTGIATGSDGSISVVGTEFPNQYSCNTASAGVVRFDEDGNRLWEYSLPDSLLTAGKSVVVTDDGGVVFSAMRFGHNCDYENPDDSLATILTKLQADGSLNWSHTLPWAIEALQDLTRDTSDTYTWAGLVSRTSNNVSQVRVMKFDADGSSLFDTTIWYTYSVYGPISIKSTEDGGYLFIDGGLRKLNPGGITEWVYPFGAHPPSDAIVVPAGGYVVTKAEPFYWEDNSMWYRTRLLRLGPEIPDGLTIVPEGNQLRLRWHACGEDYYRVYSSTSPTGPILQLEVGTSDTTALVAQPVGSSRLFYSVMSSTEP